MSTQPNERAALLPCPFCGGSAGFGPYKRDGLVLKCMTFGCVKREQRTLRKSIEWLREAMTVDWNRRAALSTPPAAAQPSIEDLCARIKAADDAAADGDYMLDSNDCIAVLRGEWKGPLAMDKPEKPTTCAGSNCGTTTAQHSPECIAEHAAAVAGGPMEREHETSADCWCNPEIDYTDPATGVSVYVHKRPQ
jgi:hypothetical protein